MAIDPVCGMEVDEKTATITSEYKGKTYYFCAPGCKRDFDKEPETYLKPSTGQRRTCRPSGTRTPSFGTPIWARAASSSGC
ncbi:MAG: YHS domain-containing protein [Chloroflexi bacterium]|nr:YHS domain-containing protein [Chloroflexota bacterium]